MLVDRATDQGFASCAEVRDGLLLLGSLSSGRQTPRASNLRCCLLAEALC